MSDFDRREDEASPSQFRGAERLYYGVRTDSPIVHGSSQYAVCQHSPECFKTFTLDNYVRRFEINYQFKD